MAQLPVETWRAIAVEAVRQFVVTRGGAVVWPEVEAFLAFSSWVPENLDGSASLGVQRIDPHHLTYARRVLEGTGELQRDLAILQKRPVAAWIHGGLSP